MSLKIIKYTSINDLIERQLILNSFAENTPFGELTYLKLFSTEFPANKPDEYIFLEVQDNGIALAFVTLEKVNTTITLIGMKHVLDENELTDYGDITALKTLSQKEVTLLWQELIKYLRSNYEDLNKLQIDFLRQDSLSFQPLSTNTSLISSEIIEVAPFISLPATWEEYLSTINKKDRQEIKRKLNRLISSNFSFEVITNPNEQLREEFFRLHKLSSRDKDVFMTIKMQDYFTKLMGSKFLFWQVKLAFLEIDGKRTASLMYFENSSQILLYNAGFDPAFNYYSPGLMLNALIIRSGINNKLKKYDFLRGNERYKYDLGGIDQNLYKIIINLK